MSARLRNVLETSGRLAHTRSVPSAGVVLAYHDVIAAGESPPNPYAVTARALRAQLRLVKRLGLRLVELSEFTDRLLYGAGTAGLASVTFDDALVGVYRHALPILLEEEAPATLLPVTGVLGVRPEWWPGSARTMTRSELDDAVAAGLGIAAHTRTHRSLPELDDSTLADELAGARAELADIAGQPVDVLAYPFGHHDARVRSVARAAGYRAGFTFLNGRMRGGEDLFRLPRLTMGQRSSRLRFGYHLSRPADSWPDHQLPAVGPCVRSS
ncbi:MAG: polysaccharide deacetylase family protein [Geodermatophilaceae bacterium]